MKKRYYSVNTASLVLHVLCRLGDDRPFYSHLSYMATFILLVLAISTIGLVLPSFLAVLEILAIAEEEDRF